MSGANANGWRNVIITALLSILLTVAGGWIAWGRQAVTREDVATIWAPDRQTITQLRAAVQGLTEQVQRHGEQLARLEAVLDRLERQLNRSAP